MQTLMDAVAGAYRVVTVASTYLIDLDRAVIRREPRTGHPEGALLRRDEELVTLLEIIECSVDRPMTLLLDLHVLGVPYTARYATRVVSIEQVASPGCEGGCPMTAEPEPLSADQVRMAAAAQALAAGDVIAIDNGWLTKVHPAGLCAGTHCWVHNPSDHHMTGWPIRWRADKLTAERVCEHGIGHPDPDDRAYHYRHGRDVAIHGCDGCCAPRTAGP